MERDKVRASSHQDNDEWTLKSIQFPRPSIDMPPELEKSLLFSFVHYGISPIEDLCVFLKFVLGRFEDIYVSPYLMANIFVIQPAVEIQLSPNSLFDEKSLKQFEFNFKKNKILLSL